MENEICIDLGSGKAKKDNYYGIDCAKIKGVDMLCNLDLEKEEHLPFADCSVDKVFTRHFLEHISDPLLVIEEIHRILKIGGEVEIIVPHWSWYGSHTFMHRRFFHSMDFDFFEENHPSHYYTSAEFKILAKKIIYKKFSDKRWLKPAVYFINRLLNKNLSVSENFLVNLLMPEEIRVVMRKED